ncbi:conserved hypothetical protein [Thermobaculum terrenum ATCC BAA-798]|uniref:Cytoskeleton protein RodZ-like C-terminal domain-containing protein n=1 Tax=Thermobaculum terrenum (strain ATCC BAA-798 / CCMEE 7001 / YNP1) TaxID=525904 RepID=D1CBL2_THET1|nr:RodZ domain-containing protein [Thermobaculum terrenum]ACZ42177.1 conserved hypothetical protein [Thermobaculum terrenum ATCC BAA-798]
MQDIGEALRDARLSKGLTYEYVSQIIKIRPEFLKAMEENRFDLLPGAFYAKNFLRRYADFLGLDSDALVESFNELEAAHEQHISAAANTVSKGHISPSFGAIAVALVLIAAIAVLAYGVVVSPRNKHVAEVIPTPSIFPTIPPTTPTPTVSRIVNVPTPTLVSQSKSTPTVQPSPTPTSTPNNSQKTAGNNEDKRQSADNQRSTDKRKNQRSHKTRKESKKKVAGNVIAHIKTLAIGNVVVRADGDVVFSGTMKPGQEKDFGAYNQLYIYSNNAQNLLVSVNGCSAKTLDQYGCPGCVIAYYYFPSNYYRCS